MSRRTLLLFHAYADLLKALSRSDARALVIGSNALRFHRPTLSRAPADLDILLDPAIETAELVIDVLRKHVAPTICLDANQLARPNVVARVGRVDLITPTPGFDFTDAWAQAEEGEIDGVPVRVASENTLRSLLNIAIARDAEALRKAQADLALLDGPA